MRDLESKQQAEDMLFKRAAREIHAQGTPWFSILDAAAQIAAENKKLRSRSSLGDRVLRFFGVGRMQAEPAATIDSDLYGIAGRLQNAGSLESFRQHAEAEGLGTTDNDHLYRLIEEPEVAVG